jgi:hypothetical protein
MPMNFPHSLSDFRPILLRLELGNPRYDKSHLLRLRRSPFAALGWPQPRVIMYEIQTIASVIYHGIVSCTKSKSMAMPYEISPHKTRTACGTMGNKSRSTLPDAGDAMV